MCAAAAAD